MRAGGQNQGVIGNNAPLVYAELDKFVQRGGDVSEGEEPQRNPLHRLIDLISSILSPILWPLAASGLLKAFLSAAIQWQWLDAKSQTYVILNATADAIFYCLPLFLAVTAAKRFRANQFTAMAIAGALVHPALVALNTGDAVRFWQVFVVFGLHWGFIPLFINDFTIQGNSLLVGPLLPAGVTEPGIYGVNLPLKRPFCFGAVGGAVAAGGSAPNAFLFPSLLALPAFSEAGSFVRGRRGNSRARCSPRRDLGSGHPPVALRPRAGGSHGGVEVPFECLGERVGTGDRSAEPVGAGGGVQEQGRVGVDAEPAQFAELALHLGAGRRGQEGVGDGVGVQAVLGGDGPVHIDVGEASALDVPGVLEGTRHLQGPLGGLAAQRRQGGRGVRGVHHRAPLGQRPQVALAERDPREGRDPLVRRRYVRIRRDGQRPRTREETAGQHTQLDAVRVLGGELPQGRTEAVAPAAVGVEGVSEPDGHPNLHGRSQSSISAE